MRQKFLITILIASIFTVSLSRLVFAAETEVAKTNAENLDESVSQLIEVKDDKSISESDRLTKEIEARKQVVKDAIDLSLQEISGIKKSLTGLTSANERVVAFKNASLKRLDSAAAFYETKGKDIDSIAELDPIKTAAKEIKDYRESGYNAEIERTNSLLLLLQTDSLIKVTQTRWNKINIDLKKLERGQFINPGYFNASMQKAQKYINDATNLSNEAKEQILKEFETEVKAEEAAMEAQKNDDSGSRLETAATNNDTNLLPAAPDSISTAKPENENSSSTDTTTPDSKEQNPKTPVIVNPKELAAASLTNLKSSYDIFLKISQSVKKILQ